MNHFDELPKAEKIDEVLGEDISVFALPKDGVPFSIALQIKAEDIIKNVTPHAYVLSADGCFRSRFCIDNAEIPEHLSPLTDEDSSLELYDEQILDWAKKSPIRMKGENIRTNWDAMRSAWKDYADLVLDFYDKAGEKR